MFVKRQFVKKRYHGNTSRNTFLYYVLGLPPSIQLLIQITKDDNETALKTVTRKNRNFKIQRRRQQRERQINNWFYKQSTTFFVHFFACFCTTTTWKCLILRFAGDIKSDSEIQFLFYYLDMVPRNSTPGGFANIWQRKWVGIIAIKTERTQIHFLSDILITVASLDLKVANDKGDRPR